MCYSHFLSLFFLSPAPPCAGLSSVGVSASRLPGPEEAKNHGGVCNLTLLLLYFSFRLCFGGVAVE